MLNLGKTPPSFVKKDRHNYLAPATRILSKEGGKAGFSQAVSWLSSEETLSSAFCEAEEQNLFARNYQLVLAAHSLSRSSRNCKFPVCCYPLLFIYPGAQSSN